MCPQFNNANDANNATAGFASSANANANPDQGSDAKALKQAAVLVDGMMLDDVFAKTGMSRDEARMAAHLASPGASPPVALGPTPLRPPGGWGFGSGVSTRELFSRQALPNGTVPRHATDGALVRNIVRSRTAQIVDGNLVIGAPQPKPKEAKRTKVKRKKARKTTAKKERKATKAKKRASLKPSTGKLDFKTAFAKVCPPWQSGEDCHVSV